jgi:hypothetical protein
VNYSGILDTLQIDMDRREEWAVENEMKINPSKSNAVSFTRARVKDRLNNFGGKHRIPEASSCKYLGIILGNESGLVRLITQYKKSGRHSFRNACF